MDVVSTLYFVVWIICVAASSEDTELTKVERDFVEASNYGTPEDKPAIVMDEAWLTVNNSESFDVSMYAHNHQCWKCEMVLVDTIEGSSMKTTVVSTTYGTDIELRRFNGTDESLLCRFEIKFRESGDYWLFFEDGTEPCFPKIVNDPMVAEMPILYVTIGLVVLGILIKVFFHVYRKRRTKEASLSETAIGNLELKAGNNTDSNTAVTTHSKKARLKSLDTLRGLSLVLMIFVNYGGGGYWFFDHLPWNGLTVADLVFPWFVFMMGAAMNYSFKSMFKRNKSRVWILWKVVKRSALLFAFGIILNTNWGPVKLTNLRIPGVMQRLSLSYLIVALTETAFARKQWDTSRKNKFIQWTSDIVFCIPQWIVSLVIMGVYIALTLALDVPGCPSGYIGPGGLHIGGRYYNCTGGAAGYIDRLVLGDTHIYNNPTPKKIYQTVVPYDPEGILGTLTSIFLCFLGLQAGRIFVVYSSHKERILRLIIWAVLTGLVGGCLCNFSMNDGVIPVNKNLWSISFIMVTGCFAFVMLCVLYIAIDIFKLWDGDPFIFTGMNPLAIYLCHDIFYRFFPVNFVVDPVHWQLLLKATWDVLIWVTLGYVLYVKKIFIAL